MKLASNIMRWWRTGSEQQAITAPGYPKGDPFVVRVEERWASGGGVILANVLIFALDAKDAKERVKVSACVMLDEINAAQRARAANLRRIMAEAPPEAIERTVANDLRTGEQHAANLLRIIDAMDAKPGEAACCNVEPLDRAGAYKLEWSTSMLGS